MQMLRAGLLMLPCCLPLRFPVACETSLILLSALTYAAVVPLAMRWRQHSSHDLAPVRVEQEIVEHGGWGGGNWPKGILAANNHCGGGGEVINKHLEVRDTKFIFG